MPFAFVDLDLFDQNLADIKQRAGNKTIRIASKSIRCTHLMQRILATGAPFKGVMAYTPAEAIFLSEQHFDDLLVAYPCWHEKAIGAVCETLKKGKRIILMADKIAHIERLNSIGQARNVPVLVCLDIDMSSRYPGLHFGTHRSSINSVKTLKPVLKAIRKSAFVRLVGIMGYEGQIASLNDAVPQQKLMNGVVRVLKKRSISEVSKRRTAILKHLQQQGFAIDFVNGGGTGSLESTTLEEGVTEVTVGSGFYAPGLFDHFSNFKHAPAAAYAIEITRNPRKGIYTCYGGGYTASGAMAGDKLPKPYLPKGAALTPNEGAGEVQTPIVYTGKDKIDLGDPIFLRHSKAGELCERFNALILVKNGKIVNRVPTYRGQGKCFL